MQITGGTIVFARVIQPAQYESKKAEVTLTFALSEGEQIGDYLDQVGSMAQNKALEMVGLKPATTSANPKPETAQAGSAEKPVEPRKPRANANKAANTKKDDEIPGTAQTAPPATSANTSAKTDDLPAADPKPNISTGEARVAPGDVDPDLVAPTTISDETLVKFVSTVAAKYKDGSGFDKIRDFRDTFPGSTKVQVRQIPQELRKAFVDFVTEKTKDLK